MARKKNLFYLPPEVREALLKGNPKRFYLLCNQTQYTPQNMFEQDLFDRGKQRANSSGKTRKIKPKQKSEMKSGTFLVELPLSLEGGIIPIYADIPKIGETEASTEAEAATHHVYRNVQSMNRSGKEIARLICGRLNRMSGLEHYAVQIPDVRDAEGELMNYKERKTAVQMALAQEMAVKYGGRADSYWGRSIRSLKRVGHKF